MKSQAIHENMHNKQIESIVNDIVTKALKGSSSSQSSSKSSNKSNKSAYGQAPTVNDDLDLPKKDESNSLAGQA